MTTNSTAIPSFIAASFASVAFLLGCFNLSVPGIVSLNQFDKPEDLVAVLHQNESRIVAGNPQGGLDGYNDGFPDIMLDPYTSGQAFEIKRHDFDRGPGIAKETKITAYGYNKQHTVANSGPISLFDHEGNWKGDLTLSNDEEPSSSAFAVTHGDIIVHRHHGSILGYRYMIVIPPRMFQLIPSRSTYQIKNTGRLVSGRAPVDNTEASPVLHRRRSSKQGPTNTEVTPADMDVVRTYINVFFYSFTIFIIFLT